MHRRVLYLLLLVYYKRYNSGIAKWKRCTGPGMGEKEVQGRGAPYPLWAITLSGPHCVRPPGSSPPHHLGFFVEVSLHGHERFNHWSLVIELFFFLAASRGLQDLSFPTRDQTRDLAVKARNSLVIELNLQPFSPSWRLGGGTESSNHLITAGLSGHQPPSWSSLGSPSHQLFISIPKKL